MSLGFHQLFVKKSVNDFNILDKFSSVCLSKDRETVSRGD